MDDEFMDQEEREIYEYQRLLEKREELDINYLAKHPEIKPHHLTIAFNWIYSINQEFGFSVDTTFLTFSIVQRFLNKTENIPPSRLKNIVLLSSFIASKYKERHLVSIKEYIDISDQESRSLEILNIENEILKVLDWNISSPTIYDFLSYYMGDLELGQNKRTLVIFIALISATDSDVNVYSPSIIASSVILVLLRLFGDKWDKTIERLTGYKEEEVKQCAKNVIISIKKERVRNEKGLSKEITEDYANKQAIIALFKRISK
jgi:hypothetical protein